MKIPKTKKEFENCLIYAFNQGMNAGYAVEHTNITEEENKFRLDFAKSNDFSKGTIEELEEMKNEV